MGYNLDYACKRFKYNENCQLFHQILSGQVSSQRFVLIDRALRCSRPMKMFIII